MNSTRRFQPPRFLAHYKIMCPANERAAVSELTPSTSVDAAIADKPAVPPPQIQPQKPVMPPEFGGRDGPEPTRYGDWEKSGRCIDF